MPTRNATHDPARRSWLGSANQAGTDFPIQNLPLALFRPRHEGRPFRGGVAIGDQIVDLAALSATGLLSGLAAEALAAASAPTLNGLMALGEAYWSALRQGLSELLREGASDQAQVVRCLRPQGEAEYRVPADVGDYTDFYTSRHHATRVGQLFRPDHPLLPNYHWVPIGYHGRSSSLVISGTPVRRPWGQLKGAEDEQPQLAPSRRLDYELELAAYIGPGNALGEPIPLTQSEAQLFGVCLMNDWSARDIQAWEYQPLGPFLGKSFATSLSPWIVTLEALAPFRSPWGRDEHSVLPYLDSAANRLSGAISIELEVWLQSARMRSEGLPAVRLSGANFSQADWTWAQLVAHHSVNGCNLRPGDLLGSGTQSGPTRQQGGCLLELSHGGQQPVALGNGENRCFLHDGDTVTLRGWCEAPGAVRIGLGEVQGTVQAAQPRPSSLP